MNAEQLTIEQILRVAADPCERKHKGSPTSIEAHKKALTTKEDVYRRTMDLLRARGEYGATSKEIARAIGRELNTVSGRFTELKTMKWIKESGAKRDGAAVLICEAK